MKFLAPIAIILLAAANVVSAGEPAKLPTNKKMQIYLLIGQSNMAGRGKTDKEDKTPHARVLMFETNNSWQPAIEPLTKDPHKYHGVGPGLAFAKAMADKDSSVTIGLVSAAVGGTQLSRWIKGADLYENAVKRAKFAIKDGTLAGILWHQGESDCDTEEHANTYE
ncbi:MAG: hypothetical protein JWO95_2350, partial [Verrucomicrobiales bacterium]|nr:hypothetical protein [Verrucomicrobiales bacterium]